jgi:N-acetylmuramoyl-L-alanine amidase
MHALGDNNPKIAELKAMLAKYGYSITESGYFDANTGDVVRAFQRHFRPDRVDGAADASTIATLTALLAAREERQTADDGRQIF